MKLKYKKMKKIILNLLIFAGLTAFSQSTPISALPSASAIVGTEVFPIVQGGATKKAQVGNLPYVSITAPRIFTTSTIGYVLTATNTAGACAWQPSSGGGATLTAGANVTVTGVNPYTITAGGGSVSLPAGQIGYGTGTSYTSSPALTFTSGALLANSAVFKYSLTQDLVPGSRVATQVINTSSTGVCGIDLINEDYSVITSLTQINSSNSPSAPKVPNGFYLESNAPTVGILNTNASGNFKFFTNNTERASIGATGNFSITNLVIPSFTTAGQAVVTTSTGALTTTTFPTGGGGATLTAGTGATVTGTNPYTISATPATSITAGSNATVTQSGQSFTISAGGSGGGGATLTAASNISITGTNPYTVEVVASPTVTNLIATGTFSAGGTSTVANLVLPSTGTITGYVNRIPSVTTQAANPTISTDRIHFTTITGLAQAITSVTMTGTPFDGQLFEIRITDNGTGRAITWGSQFTGSLLPTTTVASTRLRIYLEYDSALSQWVCVGSL